MKLLTLDIATRTGFCVGIAGQKPSLIKAVHLRGRDEVVEDVPFNLRGFIHALHSLENFDMMVVEAPLPVHAQKSAEAAIIALGCYLAAYSYAKQKHIQFRKVSADSVALHFLGKGRWYKADGGRPAKKAATVQRCHVVGYLPRTCNDDDMADACALFDYASYVLLRRQRLAEDFHLFGEEP